ncbi:MAG TPA: SprB repeat-containing protein, partial [Puia sp.]|nr:SprB repeat-containing protein [Puia sp.]
MGRDHYFRGESRDSLLSALPQQLQHRLIANLNPVKRIFHVTGAISLTVTTVNTTCMNSNGSFVVSASGGTPPYQFSEDGYPFQATGTFQYLQPGVYNVTVQDAVGQTATTTVTLTNTLTPPTLNIFGYVNPPACSGTDGTVTLLASGGTPPYLYTDDYINWQSSPTMINLPASYATYSFFVKDANGCFAPCPFFFGYYCSLGFQVGGAYTDICGT